MVHLPGLPQCGVRAGLLGGRAHIAALRAASLRSILQFGGEPVRTTGRPPCCSLGPLSPFAMSPACSPTLRPCGPALMSTDPFRELERLTQQFPSGTWSRPSAMPMDGYREGDEYMVPFVLPGVTGHTASPTM